MKDFQAFLADIQQPDKRARMGNILQSIRVQFPQLKEEIKWNQPMFTDHGTFIIGFSVAKGHIAVSPEGEALQHFQREIEEAGYTHTRMLFRIPWTEPVDFSLLHRIAAHNIEAKRDVTSFWR